MDLERLRAVLSERVLPELKPQLELQDHITALIPPFGPLAHVGNWPAYAERLRQRILDEVVFRGVPDAWRDPRRAVMWGDSIDAAPDYRIHKLRFEAVPGLWIPALLYEPTRLGERVPAVLNVNGHVGAPGKAVGYKQIRCINLAKRGLLALNLEWLWFGELQGEMYAHNRAAYLDLVGVSGLAVFFLAMQRGLDVLLEHPHTDPARVAVTGLSGGGWQTIVLSALDTRVRLAAPVAGYIGLEQRAQCRGDIGDLEQNASDLVKVGDYTWLTALLAPRPALLTYNQKDDCCFQAPRAKASVFDPVVPLYRALGAEERFAFHTNLDPGTHNYELDNRQQFYRFLKLHGYTAGPAPDDEIPCAEQVRTEAALNVGVPGGNADFRSLALACCAGLPKRRVRARTAVGLLRWQVAARVRLAELLRYRETSFQATLGEAQQHEGALVRHVMLCAADGLTLPAVEFIPVSGNPVGTLVAAADGGRGELADVVQRALARNLRVLALDVLLTGEYRMPKARPGQVEMMLATAGERPLGMQAAQLGAVARWAAAAYNAPVTVLGLGREAGTAALLAAGLGAPVAEVVAQHVPASLRVLIERGVPYEECPTLFCFGLLEQFDVRELVALALPRRVVLVQTEGGVSRTKREFAPLVGLAACCGGRVSVCEE